MKTRAVLAACGMLLAAGAAAHVEPSPATSAPDYDKALAVSQAAVGRQIGGYQLVDQNRRSIALTDYRGKPLVVSFVYTACSQACPVATQFLAKAVKEARAALGPDKFNVITIGFNQPLDSPEAMAAFARQNGIRDPNWGFLSADAATMQAITRAFGFTWYATPKGFDHISQVTIVDAGGVVYRQVYGDAFELRMLVEPLKQLLSGQAGGAGFAGVWDKVKLFCTVYDPGTGGYRVNYSLFVEIFTGATVLVGIAWFLIRERRRLRT
ncbi:MAG: SCO family protein [Burkholderiales bacterium]